MAAEHSAKEKRKQWSTDSMAAAVKSGMSLRKAAKLYNVPVETTRQSKVGLAVNQAQQPCLVWKMRRNWRTMS